MNIVKTILTVDKSACVEDIMYCISIADTIIFKDGIYLVTDADYIYYFGAVESSRVPSKLGKFVRMHKNVAKGKLFYSINTTPFNRYTTKIDPSKNLYKWC